MRRTAPALLLCCSCIIALTGFAAPSGTRSDYPASVHERWFRPSYHVLAHRDHPKKKRRRVEHLAPSNDPAPPPVATTTTTLPPPPPPPTGDWKALTMSLSWDGSLMVRIAWCESGWNPLAQNPYSSAHGIFQLLGETSNDPITQTWDAYHLWQEQGYGAWSASSSCWG